MAKNEDDIINIQKTIQEVLWMRCEHKGYPSNQGFT